MLKILVLPAVAWLVAGCATPPQNSTVSLDAPQAAEQTQIQNRLTEVFDAATKKDFARLDSYHLYGPKFTKFATESPDREDATAAREAEHRGLEAVNGMVIHVENLKIDVFDKVGVATFRLRYSFKAGADAVEREAKGTLVLVDDAGSWKIVHEHFSAIAPKP
jgi:ketosteroid isomerase-like protein